MTCNASLDFVLHSWSWCVGSEVPWRMTWRCSWAPYGPRHCPSYPAGRPLSPCMKPTFPHRLLQLGQWESACLDQISLFSFSPPVLSLFSQPARLGLSANPLSPLRPCLPLSSPYPLLSLSPRWPPLSSPSLFLPPTCLPLSLSANLLSAPLPPSLLASLSPLTSPSLSPYLLASLSLSPLTSPSLCLPPYSPLSLSPLTSSPSICLPTCLPLSLSANLLSIPLSPSLLASLSLR